MLRVIIVPKVQISRVKSSAQSTITALLVPQRPNPAKVEHMNLDLDPQFVKRAQKVISAIKRILPLVPKRKNVPRVTVQLVLQCLPNVLRAFITTSSRNLLPRKVAPTVP